MVKSLSARTLLKLAEARQVVLEYAAAQFTPKFIIRRLQTAFNASFRYARGTTGLRCARVEVSNTAGDEAAMLKGWLERAMATLAQAPSSIPAAPRATTERA